MDRLEREVPQRATLGQRRVAVALFAAMLLGVLALVPRPHEPWPVLPWSLPIMLAVTGFAALIASFVFFRQAWVDRRASLALLGGAYLTMAICSLADRLAFPGVLHATVATSQTSAWMAVFRVGQFPLWMLAYAWSRRRERRALKVSAERLPRTEIALSAAAALLASAAVIGLGFASSAFPPLLIEGHFQLGTFAVAWLPIGLLCAIALVALAATGELTLVELCLMLGLVAELCSVMLSLVVKSRYSLRWYARQGLMLFEAPAMMLVLAYEAGRVAQVATLLRARLSAATEFRLLAEATPSLVWTSDGEGRLDYVSPSFLAYTGLQPSDLVGGTGVAAIYPDDRPHAFPTWLASARPGQRYERSYRLRGADGAYRWFLTRAVPGPVGGAPGTQKWFGTTTDIHDQKQAERALQFLSDAGERLATSRDLDETLRAIVTLAVPAIADVCAVYLRHNADSPEMRLVTEGPADKSALLQRLHREFPNDERRPPVRVMRHGASLLITDVTPGGDGRYDELKAALGTRSLIAVPMFAADKPIGSIVLLQIGEGHRFTETDLRLAEAYGRRAEVAIDNARAFARERRIADTLQRALLPAFMPDVEDLAFHSVYRPSTDETSVGGDWYDAFLLRDGAVAISIGDVAGHGLEAGITMGRVRQSLRTSALQERSPDMVLQRANALLTMSGTPTIVTAIFAILDRRTYSLQYASAGHPPVLIAGNDGAVRELATGNLPLGVAEGIRWPVEHALLEPGDMLAFYTDGLIEYDRDILAGLQTLRTALALAKHDAELNPAEAIVARVLVGKQRDDVALLTVALRAEPRERVEAAFRGTRASAPEIRARLRDFLAKLPLDDARTFDLLVAAGEATNNALEHGFRDREGTLILRALHFSDRVLVEIEDDGCWKEPSAPSGGLEERGRGTSLMGSLADRFDVERGPTGTRVRLAMTLDRAGIATSPAS